MDGPSGSGKSSTSRGVARALGLRYLDTGAQFRAMTLWLLDHQVDLEDPAAIAAASDQAVIE
ncbi:MAG: (d)CMP kinase, partial [Actinomycetota bacterium]|nr:(d)CMP kinase [Actinomycetota bacterium]